MNDQEQEKKENNVIEEKYNEAKEKTKSAKNIIKMSGFIKSVSAAIITFIHVFWPIILGCIFLLGITYLLDKLGDINMSNEAAKTVIEENVKIQSVSGTDDYYFELDKDTIESYLKYLNKAYFEGYYHFKNDDLNREGEFVYDPENADVNEKDLEEWFKTKEYKKYVIKMIRAQIASSYPKLGDEEGTIIPYIDPINPIDENGNYVQQGIAEIQRTKINKDGTTEQAKTLTFLPYDKFQSLVQNNSQDALNHFSFKPETGLIYYATYTEKITTVNGAQVPELCTIEINESTASYKAITKMCEMPFDFLFILLQESENPEYIMAVIDLLLEDSQVVLMVQDELTVTTEETVNTSYHAEKRTQVTHHAGKSEETGKYYWSYDQIGNTNYSYPTGNAETETTVVTTYQNTANVYIKEAYTWCIDFEQGAVEPIKYNMSEGEESIINYEYSDSDIMGLEYSKVSTMENLEAPTSEKQTKEETIIYTSNNTLLYSTSVKCNTETYRWDIVPIKEKRINYEKFLGLWKNDTGKYELYCRYNPNGKLVKFDLPEDSDEKYNVPAIVIPDHDEQRIEDLLDELADCEDTEMQELLMKYYWNIYIGKEVYDVNVEEILDLFNTSLLTTISGGKLENYIKAWKNSDIWKYDTGLSSILPSEYMSEDGLYYIVYEDGSNRHNNISYGMATFITNPNNVQVNHPKYGGGYYNWQSEFSSRGVDVTTLDTGSLVAKDVADEVFLEILAGFESEVDTYLSNHGIMLSQNQRDALVAVCYQYGNILGFAEAYQNSLDEQGNLDPEAIKENFILVSNGNEKPFDYSSTSDRKYANWHLFTQEIYIDPSGDEINAVGGSILECAKQIHDYMSDPSHLYYYCLGGSESSINEHRSAGISNCGLSANFANSKVPGNYGYRLTCCATFVSWVLQEAGELDAHADGVLTLANYLKERGWSTVSSYSELQPADVVIMDTDGVNNGEYAHVQLYVGNGTWYNAGKNSSIHQVEPYSANLSDKFVFALRAPN